jgi:hypothetical protein
MPPMTAAGALARRVGGSPRSLPMPPMTAAGALARS